MSFDWTTAKDEDIDFEYSPSQHALKPLPEYLEDYRNLSAAHNADDLRVIGQPLLIYIHGGYWQRLSAADSLFNAPDAQKHKVSLHAVEYTLAPHATIPQIVDECVNDVLETMRTLAPTHVVLAGCSAGAHLAAMCSLDNRISEQLSGLALLSGIYDVRPIIHTSINEPLFLTAESSAAISPQLLPAPNISVAILAVGAHESGEFKRQNREFAQHLRSAGVAVQINEVEQRDHFNLPYDLLDGDTQVGHWVLQQLGRRSR